MKTLSLVIGTAALTAFACEEKKTGAPKPAETSVAQAVPSPVAQPDAVIDRSMLVQFTKLPETFASATNPITKEKVELGRQLYWDTRLSKSQEISCNSCHNLATFGVDNEKTSPGHKKQRGNRNSPTVYNAAGHFAQFWDGRAKDVEEQAKGPILNPVEMAMPADSHVLKVINSIPTYVEAFKKAFPGEKAPVSYDNLGKAIGAFERTLSVSARFDKYVAGDESALSKDEKRGLSKFLDLTCVSCHTGSLLGGTEYKKLGLVKPYEDAKDLGRFEVTKSEGDKQMFKVPSLRNVAKTAPYFHDGSVATLEEAIKLMAKHQIGKSVSEQDSKDIAAFLGSLTGEPTADMMKKPELPASTAKTPKPDLN